MDRIAPLPVLATLLMALAVAAQEPDAPKAAPPEAVSYWKDVRPIFQAHCQGCHQPAKPSGDYVMTSLDALRAGGESGEAAIVPHDPDASYLIAQITPADGQAAMPQDQPPLNDAQLDVIRRWIAQGSMCPAAVRRCSRR